MTKKFIPCNGICCYNEADSNVFYPDFISRDLDEAVTVYNDIATIYCFNGQTWIQTGVKFACEINQQD